MADYNINAITRRVVYTGSAGLGPYSFTFEVLDQNDIAVYFNATKLTITTDYTVTVNANGTGSVTIVTGGSVPATPDADDSITIVGARDIERTTDFVTAGDLRAAALNEQLDGQIIMTQQLAEENKRSMQAPVTDPAHVDDGGTLDMTLPAKADRAGKYLQFNSTTGNPEAGPDTADVTTLADIATDIATLADIVDGTDATDAIQDVAAIASDVSSVAAIDSNVTTVAGISADVTAVAGDATDIGAVAAKATEIGRLGTADAVSDLNTLGTADAVADMNTLAAISSDITSVAGKASLITSDFVSDLNQVAVADVISDINTLATSDIVADLNLLATSDFVADLNTMATAATVADLDTLADISADITTAAGVSANITTVAGQISPTNNIATVAGDSANIGTVAGDSADIGTLAAISSDITTASSISSDITTVSTNNANVTTVASNITGVNSFAERYRVGSADPTTSLDEGDLAYNTTDNALKYYNGTSWSSITAGLTDIVGDVTPQLGGDLDLNSNDITGTGDINITGSVTADGLTVDNGASQTDIQIESDVASNIKMSKSGTDYFRIFVSEADSQIRNLTATPMYFRTNDTDRINIAGNGDISFYDSTGTTQGLFWDASTQRLGLGTTSPDAPIEIESSGSDYATFKLNAPSNTTPAGFLIRAHDGDFDIRDANNNATRMTIDSSGNVGIGTTSPSLGSSGSGLHIRGLSNKDGTLKLDSSTANYSGVLQFTENGTDQWRIGYDATNNHLEFTESGVSDRMVIQDGGNVGIGVTNPGSYYATGLVVDGTDSNGITVSSGTSDSVGLYFADGTSGNDRFRGYVQYEHASNNLLLGSNASENLRIKSNGSITARSEGGTNNIVDLRQGSAKMWAQYDQGSGTSLNDSYNVSSITDVSNGRARLAINNDMNNAGYSTGGICDSAGNIVHQADPTTSQVDLRTQQTDGSNYDYDNVGPAVHGDLA